MKEYYVYILECSDGSFYTGVCNDLGRRFDEHQEGADPKCYTYKRRPVRLIHREISDNIYDILEREKQIKKWSRAKKKALINENWDQLMKLSKNYTEYGNHPSTSSGRHKK